MKSWLFVLVLGLAVYAGLFVYTFSFSQIVKERSIEKWLEIESRKSVSYVEGSVCRECHSKVYKIWIAGNHSRVECESCHGHAAEHVKLRNIGSVVVEKTRDSCLVCHKQIIGREIIATVSEGHGSGVICIFCHDPHR